MMTEKLLTPDEVAAWLGVNKTTLARWRSTKRYNLPYIKVGTRVLYQTDDVQNFIEKRMFAIMLTEIPDYLFLYVLRLHHHY